MTEETKPSVAFMGVGIMGRSMAGHLQAAGHPMHIYTRTKAKAESLLAAGAAWHDSAASAAEAADVVITIVGYPHDVEDVYLGSGRVVQAARRGAVLVDMTTSKPSLAVRIYAAAKARGVGSLDAPVTGGDIGAKNAKLSILVGGDQADYDRVLPLFQKMGTNIRLQGPAGAGQHGKLANQIVVASNMLAVCEGLTYAKRAGLDPKKVLESISTGAAASALLTNLGPKALDGDWAPGFMVHHFVKDMAMALEECRRLQVILPGLEVAKRLYDRLLELGAKEEGTQALFKVYERNQTGA